MELLYKPDWETTKQNFRAWWNHEYFGRCAISITAPKNGFRKYPPSLPAKLEDRWLDFDYLAAINEHRMQSTFYGGEAFPEWNPGSPGYSNQSVFLGCNIALKEATAWVYPIIDKGELTSYNYNDFKIDKNNKWWKFCIDVRHFAVKETKGKSIPRHIGCGACGDTLAGMRSTEKLLMDLVECPDYVRDFDLYLMKQAEQIYDEFYNIVHDGAEGSTCLFSLWSPGKSHAVQNDFAYMISSQMFNDIFLPVIEKQVNFLDHVVYHVDGIGNFKHVDALLELERIQALQILPGEGKPSPLHYMDILKKVQAAGRNLHIGIPASEVEQALEQLSARGLFIVTRCETEQDARDLLKCVEKWSVDRG